MAKAKEEAGAEADAEAEVKHADAQGEDPGLCGLDELESEEEESHAFWHAIRERHYAGSSRAW